MLNNEPPIIRVNSTGYYDDFSNVVAVTALFYLFNAVYILFRIGNAILITR